MPLSFLTRTPEEDRVVNVWGESWVRKAAAKIETIPDDPLWTENPVACCAGGGWTTSSAGTSWSTPWASRSPTRG